MIQDPQMQSLASNENGETEFARKHRIRTGGEKLFDWSVYGGIGWVVNAALSLVAIDRFEYGKHAKPFAERCKEGLRKGLAKIGMAEASQAKYAEMGFFITALYSGGTLLVPVMKMFEDNKGRLVRFADHFLHRDSDTNPDIIRAHEEMDNAPKQSWGSMFTARALSFPVGMSLGYLVGNSDAWSTKLATEGSTASKYASFARAGATIGRGFSEAIVTPNPAPVGKLARAIETLRETSRKLMMPKGMSHETWLQGIEHARTAAPHTTAVGIDHRSVRMAGNTVYELLLSSFVALGFYFSSHAFARMKDDKAHAHENAPSLPARVPPVTYLPAHTEEKEARTVPSASVGQISHEATINTAPEQSRAAV